MTLWTWIRTAWQWGGPITWGLVAICFGMSIAIGAETHTWWGTERLVDGNFIAALAITVVVALLALAWSCGRSASLTKDLRRAVDSRYNLGLCECGRLWIHHTDWELELCMARELDRGDILIDPELRRSDLSVLAGHGADAGAL